MPSSKTDTALLTRREREIMNAVFARNNRASAEEIRERLTNPPGDSAVRAMLARLEKKGYLKHRYDGPRYVYSATVSPAAAKRVTAVFADFLRRLTASDDDGSRGRRVVDG